MWLNGKTPFSANAARPWVTMNLISDADFRTVRVFMWLQKWHGIHCQLVGFAIFAEYWMRGTGLLRWQECMKCTNNGVRVLQNAVLRLNLGNGADFAISNVLVTISDIVWLPGIDVKYLNFHLILEHQIIVYHTNSDHIRRLKRITPLPDYFLTKEVCDCCLV